MVMATATKAPSAPEFTTMADVLKRLGNVPPYRVRLRPAPGTATEADLLHVLDHENVPCELVDGVLVEKAMGFEESGLAMVLGHLLFQYLDRNNIGTVVGADGPIRLFAGRVRMPDVSFISWERYPRGKNRKPIPELAPDLAVEILSKGNTAREIAIKLGEYFRSGVRLVWIVDPRKRTVRVHTAPDRFTLLTEADTLDGGDVLPGFRLVIREWFERVERQGPR
jgi:Uma2 family endonuclease